ncbi:hypothetical protein DFA_06151 [Cavenderia fasciculata]|uniref:Uncharacterized protein n=1 Tax=Cavenderia fasciculata TaxID=261658 RepID=F4PK89_CACFS|nr:uncharacterized protein DFA_06151 [Cavenderia fasciculata]EGG24013.1 hypothetical protein DFA_06151 [Cavenderia fasciculata]|eukprot:XP_004361864.1 hypothetical protein DFA_06151 [Cavenderia fasciculata]
MDGWEGIGDVLQQAMMGLSLVFCCNIIIKSEDKDRGGVWF